MFGIKKTKVVKNKKDTLSDKTLTSTSKKSKSSDKNMASTSKKSDLSDKSAPSTNKNLNLSDKNSSTASKKPESSVKTKSSSSKSTASKNKTLSSPNRPAQSQTKNEFQYIANEAHYDQVIERIKDVKKLLWIGTADIKDLYVKDGRETKPLLEVLSDLVKKGVSIRLIHAKEPGPAFREDFDKYPELIEGVERVLCPRVHFKMIIFDLKTAYVGSANLTGAGIGMKGENTRNFEAGIFSQNKEFVNSAINQFDSVWMGSFCKTCKRKDYCSDPIV